MAIAFVRELAAATGSAQNPANAARSFTLSAGATAGDLVVLFMLGKLTTNADANVVVTDSRGNTWVTDVHNEAANNYAFIASTVQNAAALVAGDTITATIQGGNTWALSFFGAWWCEEFSGQAASPWTDATASANNASGTSGVTGTTAATAQADEMAFAGIVVGSTETTLTPSAYTTFTTGLQTGSRAGIACYKILAATGTQSESFSWSPNADFSTALIATYKAAAAAPKSLAPDLDRRGRRSPILTR